MDCFVAIASRNDGGESLSLLRRNTAEPRRMRGNVVEVVFEVHALVRRPLLRNACAWPPFPRGPNRPGAKSAAAVRADIVQPVLDTVRAESALIAADARFRRIRRKFLVAIFAVWSQLQRHDRPFLLKRRGSWQIGRAIRMANIPRLR